jgi:hypothetical protein
MLHVCLFHRLNATTAVKMTLMEAESECKMEQIIARLDKLEEKRQGGKIYINKQKYGD